VRSCAGVASAGPIACDIPLSDRERTEGFRGHRGHGDASTSSCNSGGSDSADNVDGDRDDHVDDDLTDRVSANDDANSVRYTRPRARAGRCGTRARAFLRCGCAHTSARLHSPLV